MRALKQTLSVFMAAVLAAGLCPAFAHAGEPVGFETSSPARADSSTRAVTGLALHESPLEVSGTTGAIPYTVPAKSIHDANEGGRMSLQSALPAKYSSVERGNVSSVKDQGVFGTCWAFASTAAIEASMLARGQATSVDLSERHLAYFTYNAVPDPLGNTKGDFTSPVKATYGAGNVGDYLSNGGNSWIAANALATWQGAVNEDDVGTYENLLQTYADEEAWYGGENYESFLAKTKLSTSSAYALDAVHLTGTAKIALADRDDVKRAIQNRGAATVQIMFDYDYLNYENGAYYYPGTDSINHDVALVGWNDDYPRENFGCEYSDEDEKARPSKNGAWLAKNSYGSDFGNGGYFWLSYEDDCLCRDYAQAFTFEVDSSSNFGNIYQYDGSAGTCYNYVNSGGSIANVYTARANPSGMEKVSAVSFSLDDVNVDYSIQVYSGVKKSADPTSGTAMLATPLTGKTTYAGYYTVKLPSPVAVAEGSKYSVVITLSHKDGSRVAYDVDTTYGAGDRYVDWIHYTNAVQAGQSFERDRKGASWDDLSSTVRDAHDEPANSARIKAFTDNASRIAISGATVPAVASRAYNGKAYNPKPTVKYGKVTLKSGTDYTVSYLNASKKAVSAASVKAAGTYYVKITGKGKYSGTKNVAFKVTKAANPMSVAAKAPGVKYSKKTQTVAASKAYAFKKKAVGTVTYARVASGSSKWLPAVNKKTGAITVKAGAPRAKTQAVKVKVTAAGNGNYKPLSKTIAVKVKVK